MELLKLLAAVAFGGLAGQFLAEYFRRRGARLQIVTLTERVREIAPQLEGITLARLLTIEGKRQLEEIRKVREYQLTLRNSSNLHLQNIEIQFEFPTADVQSWVSRPARSQTALIPTNAIASEPWKSAFRWTIPHLTPSSRGG